MSCIELSAGSSCLADFSPDVFRVLTGVTKDGIVIVVHHSFRISDILSSSFVLPAEVEPQV
jgi:hypothetical protein